MGPSPARAAATSLEELRRNGQLALSVLGALPEVSVMVFDHDLRYALVAGDSLAKHGYHLAALEGLTLAEIVPPEQFERYEPHYRAALRGERTSCVHESRGGDVYDIEVAPVVTEAGVVGGLVICRDTTLRAHAEAELAQREREFRALAETASDVISRTDADGIYRYVSPAAARVYGWQPEEMVGRPVRDFLHVDDHAAHAELRAALRDGADEHVGEFRMAHKQGGWVWMELRYTVLRDACGELEHVQAAARDITDRKAAEAARRISDEQFRTAFDGASIGMALVALDGGFVRVNSALATLLGYSAKELLATTFQAITHPDDLDADVALMQATLAGRRASYQMEKRYVRADGDVVWVLLSVSLVSDIAGRPLHFVSQVQDVSRSKLLEAELRRLASHDDLTGLHNRRSFEQELDQQLRGSRRADAPATMLMLDLDGFKEVNDAFGHHGGDLLLKHVGVLLTERLRDQDVVARLGGDEFAVLLPQTTAAAGARVAAALVAHLAASPVWVDGAPVVAWASIGVAELEREDDAEATMRAADRSMYSAKRRRRRELGSDAAGPVAEPHAAALPPVRPPAAAVGSG